MFNPKGKIFRCGGMAIGGYGVLAVDNHSLFVGLTVGVAVLYSTSIRPGLGLST